MRSIIGSEVAGRVVGHWVRLFPGGNRREGPSNGRVWLRLFGTARELVGFVFFERWGLRLGSSFPGDLGSTRPLDRLGSSFPGPDEPGRKDPAGNEPIPVLLVDLGTTSNGFSRPTQERAELTQVFFTSNFRESYRRANPTGDRGFTRRTRSSRRGFAGRTRSSHRGFAGRTRFRRSRSSCDRGPPGGLGRLLRNARGR